MQIQNILVVCVGNICRSPMAEYFFKSIYSNLHIESAGISALVNHAADAKAQLCMQRHHINMSMHIAKKLTDDLIRNADLILVMSSNQQRHLEQTWSYAKGKTFRLGHWRGQNIPDPYQHDQAFFDESCQLIQDCVSDWTKHI